MPSGKPLPTSLAFMIHDDTESAKVPFHVIMLENI